MKIDLHCHTSEYSHCANSSAEQVILAAADRKIDAVVITDHHHHLTAEESERLNALTESVRVFRGAEFSIQHYGLDGVNWNDLLVITDTPCDFLDPISTTTMESLVEFIELTEALTILAHPFRYRPEPVWDLRQFRPDAVEVYSANVPAEHRDDIRALARKNNLQLVAATDTHQAKDVGTFFVELDTPVETERELARAIRAGAFRMNAHEDAPRKKTTG